tara:strand:+ start:272 stop:568 length:297 start_codon:yes stop_codon:yes gene_type:complete
MEFHLEAMHSIRGPNVLPDDGRRKRIIRYGIPRYDGLPLVSYSDSRDILRRGRCYGLRHAVLHAPPDLPGIMFNPAPTRIVLVDLSITPSNNVGSFTN